MSNKKGISRKKEKQPTKMSRLQRFIEEKIDEGYIDRHAPISFHEVAEQTGVSMDNSGKTLLRLVLRGMGIEYEPVIGYGIIMNNPENVVRIVNNKFMRTTRQIDRFAKACENTRKFVPRMKLEDQKAYFFKLAAAQVLSHGLYSSQVIVEGVSAPEKPTRVEFSDEDALRMTIQVLKQSSS